MLTIVIPPTETFGTGRLIPIIRNAGYKVQMSYQPIPGTLNFNWRTRNIDIIPEMINTPQAIKENDNKRISRLQMRKFLPDNSPKVYLPGKTFCFFPMVLRPDNHHGGRDLYLAKTYEEMFSLVRQHPNLTHGVQLIFPNEEFRVWCTKNYDNSIESIKFQIKEATIDTKEFLPKNHSLGNAVFKWISKHKHKKEIREVACKAFRYSPLHFGAVDILWDTSKNIPFILEINSRFGINSDSTANAMAKYIIKYYLEWKKDNK